MSELFPTRSLGLQVISCTDPSREKDFFWWLKSIHIPDLKQTPGILDVYRYRDLKYDYQGTNDIAARFIVPKDAPTRQLILFRLNTPDPWALMRQVAEDDQKRQKQGRMLDCYKSYEISAWEFMANRKSTKWQQRLETRLPDGMPNAILAMLVNVDPAFSNLFSDWWLNVHAYDLLKEPGVVETSCFRNANPGRGENEPNTMLIYEIDSDDPGAAVLQVTTHEVNIRRPAGRSDPGPSRPRQTYAIGVYQHAEYFQCFPRNPAESAAAK